MDITANVLKSTFTKRKHGTPRGIFQEIADVAIALRLLIVADRLEGLERAKLLRQD